MKPAAFLLLLLFACPAQAGSTTIEFDVFLDDRRVGTHRFDVEVIGPDLRRVSSVAAFDVRILGIRAYRYRHQAVEQWQQGCLRQISASTDDNGRRSKVDRNLQGDCASGYAYWDPAVLLGRQALLNPQTGEVDAVRIEPTGEEVLQVRGAPVRADRFRLSSDRFVIDLWYSKQREWLQLESTTDTKRMLRYRLAMPRPPASR